MRILLVSTYELGHQPLGVAGPAGMLQARGHEVRCLDLSVEEWDGALANWADRVAISVPMHTAARLARSIAPKFEVPVAAYGLYAAMCAEVATALVDRDPETALLQWIEEDPLAEHVRALPARNLLPPLASYARLVLADSELPTAYVEASTGCAHRCKHCPVPVVYDGRTRIVPVDAIVDDVVAQKNAGARHVTFGDPDFFNGIHHALRVARAVHEAVPDLTFDCTVKVEHILRHEEVWSEMAELGCLFVVSAFESVNDKILERLDKGHTAKDGQRAVAVLRGHGIAVRPTWLPFTPWSELRDVQEITNFVAGNDLVSNVDPVHYSIRLLVPQGSLLIGDIDGLMPFDPERLSYPWESPLDALQARVATIVEKMTDNPVSETFDAVRVELGLEPVNAPDISVPHLSEPWFCCAEPTEAQFTTF